MGDNDDVTAVLVGIVAIISTDGTTFLRAYGFFMYGLLILRRGNFEGTVVVVVVDVATISTTGST